MQKLAIGMQNKGFTFIELIIVLLIIAIVFTMAMLSFGDFGTSRKSISILENLKQDLSLLQEQAIITNTAFKLKFNNKNYEILQFKNNAWQIAIFKNITRSLTGNMTWNINKPNILITPTGEISQFSLTLKLNNTAYAIIKNNDDGLYVNTI